MQTAVRLTTDRTIRRGEPARTGSKGAYHRLTEGPGEEHLRRLELPGTGGTPGRRTSLLRFTHLTDIHITDVESPGRFEFVQRFSHLSPDLHVIVPSFRPQEALGLFALESMIKTVNALGASEVSGARSDMVLVTGDHTDNQALSELIRFFTVMEGGLAIAGTGGAGYQGVQSAGWGDPWYWRPDPGSDSFKESWGFPAFPELFDRAGRPFAARGLQLPWISAIGNHDALINGAALATPEYEAIATSDRKPARLPTGFDPVEHAASYIAHPELYLTGPAQTVPADPTRRAFSARELVDAHLRSAGNPRGHGFSNQSLDRGIAYYVHDWGPAVRIVVLETTNRGGDYHGSIGIRQLAWLEEKLAEVHAQHYDPRGRLVSTGRANRLVVVASHHPLFRLTNPLNVAGAGEENDLPRVLGPEVEELLHRFPNVILVVNGHTHHNTVVPHPDPSGRTAGFWEVTTCSLVDWPSQARVVEILDNQNGTISVLCTMLDHAAPPDPSESESSAWIASVHRELAANDPYADPSGAFAGTPHDRNVELLLPSPFSL